MFQLQEKNLENLKIIWGKNRKEMGETFKRRIYFSFIFGLLLPPIYIYIYIPIAEVTYQNHVHRNIPAPGSGQPLMTFPNPAVAGSVVWIDG